MKNLHCLILDPPPPSKSKMCVSRNLWKSLQIIAPYFGRDLDLAKL